MTKNAESLYKYSIFYMEVFLVTPIVKTIISKNLAINIEEFHGHHRLLKTFHWVLMTFISLDS